MSFVFVAISFGALFSYFGSCKGLVENEDVQLQLSWHSFCVCKFVHVGRTFMRLQRNLLVSSTGVSNCTLH